MFRTHTPVRRLRPVRPKTNHSQHSSTSWVVPCMVWYYCNRGSTTNNTRTRKHTQTHTHQRHAAKQKNAAELGGERYCSCRYNERQLIDVTVVRRVLPRAERRYHAYHHVRTYIRIWYIIRTWYHTYLVHNTYLVS